MRTDAIGASSQLRRTQTSNDLHAIPSTVSVKQPLEMADEIV